MTALPAAFPAAVLLVQHRSPRYPSHLVALLAPRLPLTVVGADGADGTAGARELWGAMTSVPLENRDVVRPRTDRHGMPWLVADHPLPATSEWGPLDALDWYGPRKQFDGLTACAFDGNDCAYALGDTPEQRFMGKRSDGTPVVEADVTTDPASLARTGGQWASSRTPSGCPAAPRSPRSRGSRPSRIRCQECLK